MDKRQDAVVAGGGLIGSVMALALAQSGACVTIIDRMQPEARLSPAFDGRGYALALASRQMLDVLGIWARVASQAQPILRVVVTDGRAEDGPSPLLVELDHAELDEGPTGFMVEARHLMQALVEMLAEQSDITQIHGQDVIAHEVTESGVTAVLGNGTKVEGAILIGADGHESAVVHREGLTVSGWSYGQTALVCAIGHERPHAGTAHQLFMPNGPLALLPLPGNRTSIVWTESNENAARIQAREDDGYLAALRPAIGSFLGEIHLQGDRYSYPLALSVAERIAVRRIALIGDAAHRIHPLAGQGLNVGLRDVGALTEVLIQALRRGEDIGALDVLERYQNWRRFDTAMLALTTDALNGLFSNDDSLVRGLRDLGLGAVNAIPVLRRNLMREAAGLTGELPLLLRGRQI